MICENKDVGVVLMHTCPECGESFEGELQKLRRFCSLWCLAKHVGTVVDEAVENVYLPLVALARAGTRVVGALEEFEGVLEASGEPFGRLAPLAQSAEQALCKRRVIGSTPVGGFVSGAHRRKTMMLKRRALRGRPAGWRPLNWGKDSR